MKSVSLVAVAVSLIVAASVVLELVAGQDSYKLYLTKVYIKNACSKEGHSNMNHCLKCIMKSFKGAKELQQEISVCLAGPPKTIQECFKDRKQGKEIEGCLIDKQQRINCYGIGIRKIHDGIYEEVKIKNGIIKCQAQYAMKNCPGHSGLLKCLQDNLKDYPKCFPKLEESSTIAVQEVAEN